MQKNEPPQQHPSSEFTQLADLWSRRGDLSEAQWHQLYHLVMNLLASSHVSEESSLSHEPGDRAALRQSFFTDKILLPAYGTGRRLNPTLTPGAIAVFYKRYLLDLLRKKQRRREVALPQDERPGSADSTASETGQTSALQAPDKAALLGVDEQHLRARGRSFLQAQEPWVIVYLALHFGADSAQLPLSTLQSRYRIPSYHYKAVRLGITAPRGGFAEPGDYADTMIGRWLLDCDIELCADNDELIRHAIKLLCEQAQAEFDHRGLAALEQRA